MSKRPAPDKMDSRISRRTHDRMFESVRTENFAEFQTALLQGADPNATDRDSGVPLLIYTAVLGRPEFLALLIKAKADLNCRIAGNTPLMLLGFGGITSGQMSCAAQLIDAGADLSAKGTLGTALDVAALWENSGMIKLLMNAKAPCKKTTRLHIETLQKTPGRDNPR